MLHVAQSLRGRGLACTTHHDQLGGHLLPVHRSWAAVGLPPGRQRGLHCCVPWRIRARRQVALPPSYLRRRIHCAPLVRSYRAIGPVGPALSGSASCPACRLAMHAGTGLKEHTRFELPMSQTNSYVACLNFIHACVTGCGSLPRPRFAQAGQTHATHAAARHAGAGQVSVNERAVSYTHFCYSLVLLRPLPFLVSCLRS